MICYLAVHASILAQVAMPTQNTDSVHLFTGSTVEIMPYLDGVIFIKNDGTDDIIAYTEDGVSFMDLETLESESSSKLAGWVGDSKAFYYGNNTSDVGEIDLRVNNAGSASLLLNAGHQPNPAITNVVKADFGSGVIRYYYMVQGEWDDYTGYEAIVYETDGTDNGTWEVEPDRDWANNSLLRMSNNNVNGMLEATMYDGKLYFIAETPGGGLGNYSSIFELEYSDLGSTANLAVNSGSEVATWGNLIITDDYFYAMDVSVGATSSFNFIAKSDPDNIGTIDGMHFHNEKPVRSNNRFYAVADPWIEGSKFGIRKLAVIDEANTASVINLNAEAEDDQIDNLVLSGNKLFFTATLTGGSEGIYAIRTDVADPEIVLVESLSGKTLKAMVGVPEGVAYSYVYESSSSGNFVISQGFTDADYWLHRGYRRFDWGNVTDLVVNGNTLFIAEAADDGTSVQIWSHDLTQTEFATTNVQFTITDSETSEAIVGAELMIENGLESYSLVTNSSGQAVQLGIPAGWYNYELSAAGYKTVSDARTWLSSGTVQKTLTMEADDATSIDDLEDKFVKVYPNPTNDIINIDATSPVLAVRLYDLTGTCVKAVESQNIKNVNISDLPRGVYVMVANQSNSDISTIKITKK